MVHSIVQCVFVRLCRASLVCCTTPIRWYVHSIKSSKEGSDLPTRHTTTALTLRLQGHDYEHDDPHPVILLLANSHIPRTDFADGPLYLEADDV